MNRWLKFLTAVIISLFVLFVAGLVAVGWFFTETVTNSAPPEQRAIQPPEPNSLLSNRYPSVDYQPVSLTASDGLKIQGFYAPSKNHAAVIVLHNYRGSHLNMLPVGDFLSSRGYGVLLIDLRGHGQSEGTRVTFGKDEVLDADAAYQYLAQQPGIDPQRIGIFGGSLGGSVAILSGARNPQIAAVAAVSPFPSIPDVIEVNTRRSLPTPPILITPFVNLWMRIKLGVNLDDISPARHIQAIAPRPVLLMVAGQDEMTSAEAGRRMFEAAGEPKFLWYEPELAHLAFQETMPDAFEKRVGEFFETALLK